MYQMRMMLMRKRKSQGRSYSTSITIWLARISAYMLLFQAWLYWLKRSSSGRPRPGLLLTQTWCIVTVQRRIPGFRIYTLQQDPQRPLGGIVYFVKPNPPFSMQMTDVNTMNVNTIGKSSWQKTQMLKVTLKCNRDNINSYVMSGLSLSYQHFLNFLFIFRDNGQKKIQERDVLAPLSYFTLFPCFIFLQGRIGWG